MNEERNAIVDYSLENVTNLELAYETHKAYHELCKKLSQTFLYKLQQKLEENPETKGWVFSEIPTCDMLSFMIRNEKWPETQFGLNDFNDMDNACFLVKTNEENKNILFPELIAEMQGKETGVGWWMRLREPYNTWDETYEGLKSLYVADDLLEYVAEHIMKLSAIIGKYLKPVDSCSFLPNNKRN